MIRYGCGVWSDHRRGMFRGATERQGATTTGTGHVEGSVHIVLRSLLRPLSTPSVSSTHKPPEPRELCSAEP